MKKLIETHVHSNLVVKIAVDFSETLEIGLIFCLCQGIIESYFIAGLHSTSNHNYHFPGNQFLHLPICGRKIFFWLLAKILSVQPAPEKIHPTIMLRRLGP